MIEAAKKPDEENEQNIFKMWTLQKPYLWIAYTNAARFWLID